MKKAVSVTNTIILLFIFSFVSYKIGVVKTDRKWEKTVIERGSATWAVDAQSGGTFLKWKSE